MSQWICPNCGFPNDIKKVKCWICGGRKQSQDFITATATAEADTSIPEKEITVKDVLLYELERWRGR